MGEETVRKQHRIMNYMIINNIYSSSFPKQDNEGNIILSSFKDLSYIKISSNASEIFYSDGKPNDKGEYNYIKIADVKFDFNHRPIIKVIENNVVNKLPVYESLKKLGEPKTGMELNEKEVEKAPSIRVSEAPKAEKLAEAPTAKAPDIMPIKKKEPALQEISPTAPTPKPIEMPKNTAVALGPLERLSKKEQEGKGKAERLKTERVA